MRLALTPSARVCTSTRRVEIAPRLIGQPIAQAARGMLDAARYAQLLESAVRACALHDAAGRALAGEYDAMEFAAQRHQRAIVKRHRHAECC